MGEAEWDAVMTVNLKAPYLLSLALGRAMRARGAGKIVNLADIAAERPLPRLSAVQRLEGRASWR